MGLYISIKTLAGGGAGHPGELRRLLVHPGVCSHRLRLLGRDDRHQHQGISQHHW